MSKRKVVYLFERPTRKPRRTRRRRKRPAWKYAYTRWWPDRYPGSVW